MNARPLRLATLAAAASLGLAAAVALAQAEPGRSGPVDLAPGRADLQIAAGLAGRNVDAVEVRGNREVSTAAILNVVRTRQGTPLDPATVQEDIERVYGLRRFANVAAQFQPTAQGVVVAFVVAEQRTITAVTFRGNDPTRFGPNVLTPLIDLRAGEAIDNFRIALARRAIEQFYRDRNFPFASVTVDPKALGETGEVAFVVSEGPRVRVRNIDFIGNASFPEDRLKRRIQSRSYIFLFRGGTYNPDTADDDVAAIAQFYRSKGYFDVRVGRRVLFSPDQTEAQLEFVIDEGPRYTIERVTFRGNERLTEQQLRERIRLGEGKAYDQEVVDRDVRRIVEAYSPFGLIYEPTANDPDYLDIDVGQKFRLQPGTIELVYEVREGKPFTVGNVEVRGNSRTQQKVALREMRSLRPGALYDSAAVLRGVERIRGLRLFDRVKATPIGDKPDERDLLIEVDESKTALLTFGAGVNSNGGVSGNLTYTQRNFDITNFPDSPGEILAEQAFVGAGQSLRLSLEPGTRNSNASVRFVEPYLFDQPYTLTTEGYFRTRRRPQYSDQRLGGRVSLGRRFGREDQFSVTGGLRLENVEIRDIPDEPIRAFEILEERGNNNLFGTSIAVRRDTINPGPLPYEGSAQQVQWEQFGWFGGDYDFQRVTASADYYRTLYTDLTDRRTVLGLHADVGFVTGGDAPFFERFYGGGLNSIRGFSFRGVSPRSGPDEDPIGGDFSITGSAEVGFPIYQTALRGVVFVDAGTVEDDFEVTTIRSAAGAGVRVSLPLLGQVPVALDFAFPITRDDEDETQVVSFSLGIIP